MGIIISNLLYQIEKKKKEIAEKMKEQKQLHAKLYTHMKNTCNFDCYGCECMKISMFISGDSEYRCDKVHEYISIIRGWRSEPKYVKEAEK